MEDLLLVKIDGDYGYPDEEWMEENGLYLAHTEYSRGMRGSTKFVISNDVDHFVYEVDYLSDGCIIWNNFNGVVKAKRCYQKVRTVEVKYYDETP